MTDTSLSMFRILSSEEVAEAVSKFQSNDPYDGFSLLEKVNMVAYIITVQEKQALKRLTDEGKNNFLKQFWKDKIHLHGFSSSPTWECKLLYIW